MWRKESHQPVLNAVGILILIDQQMTKTALREGARLLRAFQQLHRADEEIVEVNTFVRLESGLISREDTIEDVAVP